MTHYIITPTNLEQVKQELQELRYTRGMLVQIYCKMVSVYYNSNGHSGFLELNQVGSVNTHTSDREPIKDALDRLGEDGFDCEYYWFETLNEFCEYSLKEGWR